jgi:hypothetical protein
MNDPNDQRGGRYASKMTHEIATFIRKCRIEQDATWRAVGWMTYLEFPQLGIKPVSVNDCWVSQLDGIDLCDAAMDFLGEDVSDGWN